MKSIYIIRHGQSESNAGHGKPKPNHDIALTEIGQQQAEQVSTRLICP
ncbi:MULTISPECIES: phosphoglycerate mutase family protein [unclassified Acinetobacter]